MHDDHEQTCRAWRMSDAWWERIVLLLPPRKPHPVGGPRPRGNARQAMEAIVFVRRPGCQWQALNEPGRCARRAAHRRCQVGTAAAVFVALRAQGLVA